MWCLASQSHFSHVQGVDIAPLAVERCKEALNKRGAETSPETLRKIAVQQADFFTFRPPARFDFVFDYTFFCAIEPSMRVEWAQQMHRLIAPGGLLFTLVFPIGDYPHGPPFAVSVDAYRKLLDRECLENNGFRVVYGPVESGATVSARTGRELVVVWQRI